MTLIEALISVSLLGIMVGAILSMYFMTTTAVSRGGVKSELQSQLQQVNGRVLRDVEGAIYQHCSFDPANQAFSLISAQADDGSYGLQPNGDLTWQKYIVYYRAADNVVYRKEIDIDAAAPQRTNPTNIESYDPGGGPQPLSTYLSGGRPIAREITALTAELLPSRAIRVKLVAEKPAQGRRPAQRQTLEAVAYPRN